MKAPRKGLLLAILGAACFWVLDAAFSSIFLHNETFLNLLILNVDPHHLFVRLMAVVMAIVFGLIAGVGVAKRERAEQSLQNSQAELIAIYGRAPLVMVLVDSERRVKKVNCAAAEFSRRDAQEMTGTAMGGALGCLNSLDDPKGCGYGPSCQTCELRRTVLDTFDTGKSHHRVEAGLPLARDEQTVQLDVLVSTAPLAGLDKPSVLVCLEDITDSKKSQQDLLRSEEHFRALTESALDGVMIVSGQGIIDYHSPSIAGLLGYQPQQVVGTNIAQLIHPIDKPEVMQRFANLIQNGGIDRLELRVLHSDGNYRNMDGVANNLLENPYVRGIVINYRDITGQKRAQQQVEDLARFPSENTAPVLRIARLGHLLHANPASRQLLEKWDCQPGQQVPEDWVRLVSRALGFGASITEECEVAGRIYSLEIVPVVRSGYANLYGCDITERKEAEEQLELHSERLALSLSCARQGLWDWNVKTGEVIFGERWASILGYQVSELEPAFETWERLLHPDDSAAVLQAINEHLEHRTPFFETEFRLKTKFGQWCWILSRGKVVKWDTNGKPLRMLGTHQDITRRRQAEQALQESEEKFAKAFHASPSIMGISSLKDGRPIDINQACCRLTGYEREELIGHTAAGLNIWVDPAQRERVIRELQSKGRVSNIEVDLRTKSGEAKTLMYSAEMISLNNEECLLSVAADVTERMQAEETLRRSEELLNEMGDIARIRGWEHDLATGQATWTRATYQIAEIDSGPIPGTNEYLDHYHPQDRPIIAEAYQRSVETGEPFDLELRCSTAKGKPFWARAIGHPVFEEGKCVKMRGTFQDITDRKLAQQSLQESEEKYRMLVENQTDLIIEIDSEGRFRFVSRAFCETHGMSEGELLAKSIDFLVHEDDLQHTKQAIEKCCHPPYRASAHVRGRTKDGWRWFDWAGRGILNDRGQVVGVACVGRDVTDRKLAEERLLNYERQLRALATELAVAEDRERCRVARDLHDDVAQLLATAKVKIQDIEDNPRQASVVAVDEIKSLVEQAIRGTRSLVFDLSPPALHELGLGPAVKSLTEKIQKEHGISLSFEDDGQTEPLTEDVRTILFRAVRELLMNLVKHAQAKTAKVTITTDEANICVQVEDDGVGFDPAEVQSRKDLGGGFGLFSLRERMAYCGGSFEINSEPGQGTRATLVAPLISMPELSKG